MAPSVQQPELPVPGWRNHHRVRRVAGINHPTHATRQGPEDQDPRMRQHAAHVRIRSLNPNGSGARASCSTYALHTAWRGDASRAGRHEHVDVEQDHGTSRPWSSTRSNRSVHPGLSVPP
jgi:hypothetical protein